MPSHFSSKIPNWFWKHLFQVHCCSKFSGFIQFRIFFFFSPTLMQSELDHLISVSSKDSLENVKAHVIKHALMTNTYHERVFHLSQWKGVVLWKQLNHKHFPPTTLAVSLIFHALLPFWHCSHLSVCCLGDKSLSVHFISNEYDRLLSGLSQQSQTQFLAHKTLTRSHKTPYFSFHRLYLLFLLLFCPSLSM